MKNFSGFVVIGVKLVRSKIPGVLPPLAVFLLIGCALMGPKYPPEFDFNSLATPILYGKVVHNNVDPGLNGEFSFKNSESGKYTKIKFHDAVTDRASREDAFFSEIGTGTWALDDLYMRLIRNIRNPNSPVSSADIFLRTEVPPGIQLKVSKAKLFYVGTWILKKEKLVGIKDEKSEADSVLKAAFTHFDPKFTENIVPNFE